MKIKKLIAILFVLILGVTYLPVLVSADSEVIRPRDISIQSPTSAYKGYIITNLIDNCTVDHNSLTISNDEILIVHKNVTLKLCKDSQIFGSIYIEQGGKLLLAGGTMSVQKNASVISDGKISIQKKAKLCVDKNADLFVGKKGSLSYISKSNIEINMLSNSVVLGSCSLDEPNIGRSLHSAYILNKSKIDKTVNTDNVLPNGAEDYCCDFVFLTSKNDVVILVFDNGAIYKCLRHNNKYAYIGNSCTAMFGMYVKSSDDFKSASHNIIYEIEGEDYILDYYNTENNIYYLCGHTLVDESGIVYKDFDKLKKSPYFQSLGYLNKYRCGKDDSAVNGKAYFISENQIIALYKIDNKKNQNGDLAYYVYYLSRVK